MEKSRGEAFRVIDKSKPRGAYRGAVVGCGRMGSTIDDEHIGLPHYPWPWAHAAAMIEARNVELVAGVDEDPDKLDDFKRRWAVDALYADYREMVEKERPDIVAVTTRPEPRAEIVTGLAELGVKAVFATKPMCRSLREADAMIEACRRSRTILTVACHLNWYGWYTNARNLIETGEIGSLCSMVCHSASPLSNIHSHTLGLFRLFAGAPAKWVFGFVEEDARAASDRDLPASGFIHYDNGVTAILNGQASTSGDRWSLEFICERGKIVSRNAHADFELWSTHPHSGDPIRQQYPNPWHPRSSMVDAIEGVCRSIELGEEIICPGEFGREALEVAIAMRESHRKGNIRIDLPLADRNLRMG